MGLIWNGVIIESDTSPFSIKQKFIRGKKEAIDEPSHEFPGTDYTKKQVVNLVQLLLRLLDY